MLPKVALCCTRGYTILYPSMEAIKKNCHAAASTKIGAIVQGGGSTRAMDGKCEMTKAVNRKNHGRRGEGGCGAGDGRPGPTRVG